MNSEHSLQGHVYDVMRTLPSSKLYFVIHF